MSASDNPPTLIKVTSWVFVVIYVDELFWLGQSSGDWIQFCGGHKVVGEK